MKNAGKHSRRKSTRPVTMNQCAGSSSLRGSIRGGQEWLDQLRAYLLENLNFLRKYLQEKIPQIHLVEPEGTYLVWLDCSKLGISGKELDQFIVEKAGLWLDGGAMFGPSGADFQRVNIACPRATFRACTGQVEGGSGQAYNRIWTIATFLAECFFE